MATMQARKMPVAIRRVRFATGLLRIMVNMFCAGYVALPTRVRAIMTRALFWATITFVSVAGQAQGVDADLAKVNELFGGRVKFRIDRDDRLVADIHGAQGLVRQDVAYVEFLDADAVGYSDEEQAVVLKCKAADAQCIDKEIFKLNTIRHTGRSVLQIAPTEKEAAIAALSTLIRSAQEAQAAERAAATMPK